MRADSSADIAIAGGGLAGGLIALAIRRARPDLSLDVIEGAPGPGGAHTWSFHDSDLTEEGRALVAPLVGWRWPAQRVKFPAHQRRLATGYNSIESAQFHRVVQGTLKDAVRYGRQVAMLEPTRVIFASGEKRDYGAVIDCRGAIKSAHLRLGYQKFVGQVLRFSAPHGVAEPVIMDATVPQVDGYRFVYVLPFDERTALIEDTRYADGPVLPVETFREEIASYARLQGWSVEATIREEEGVLPIALAGDIDAFWDAPMDGATGAVPRGGMRAGLFHPLTGYSLPDAVALALAIAEADNYSAASLYALTRGVSTQAWRDRGFYRFLTRMLFVASEPERRYRVLERFYRLPHGLIERFYAGRSTFPDKARVLVGKPPVPVSRALGVINEGSVARDRQTV